LAPAEEQEEPPGRFRRRGTLQLVRHHSKVRVLNHVWFK
jgi:hypothetical protein